MLIVFKRIFQIWLVIFRWNGTNHIGHGYRAKPQMLVQKANVGYLHFTGFGTGESYFSDQGLIKFCERGGRCQPTIQSHVE